MRKAPSLVVTPDKPLLDVHKRDDMRITLQELIKKFDFLIQGSKTREEAAAWASEVEKAENNRVLEYSPSSQEDLIWDGISYLTGVDLKDSDGSYLHDIADFINYKNTHFSENL